MKKPTAKQQVWIKHYTTWSDSGLSKAAYCKQHDIKKADFYRWNNRLAQLNLIEADARQEAFLPIEVVGPTNELIQLKGGGIEIQFPGSVSHQTLKHILTAIGMSL